MTSDCGIKRVYMLTPEMESASGVAASLTTLAIELARRQIEVWVFVRRPFPVNNQYYRRLKAHNVHVVTPPRFLAFLGKIDWTARDCLVQFIVACVRPLLLAPALVDAVIRRRSWSRSWQGITNYFNRVLGKHLLPDYLDRIFYAQLNWLAYLYPPDVVEVSRGDYTPAIAWGYKRKLPVVYKQCETPAEWPAVKEKYLHQATCVIAKSEATYQALRKFSHYDKEIFIVPNAFDNSLLDFATATNPATQTDKITIIYVGRFSHEKGVQYLPSVLKQVVDHEKQVQLLMIGDGPLEENLKQDFCRHSLSNYVQFRGALDQQSVFQTLLNGHILILPSLTEGMPNVVLEGMACGIAIVATGVGGTCELITEGVTGILVAPGNSQAMAEAVISLVQDKKLRDKLGQAAQQAYETGPWTAQAVGNQTISAYCHAIQRSQMKECSLASHESSGNE